MATESERKFLVTSDGWKACATGAVRIAQAYLCKDRGRTVRVRLTGSKAFLTIKGEAAPESISVPEFEYSIPADDARSLLRLCLPGKIEKTRHLVPYKGRTWELDVFEGENAGLVVAEIELEGESAPFDLPEWAGKEVTFDPRYKNTALSENPFLTW